MRNDGLYFTFWRSLLSWYDDRLYFYIIASVDNNISVVQHPLTIFPNNSITKDQCETKGNLMHKFLWVSGYQLYVVQKQYGFTDHGYGQLYHNGELVGYMEETDRDEDRIWYDHFVREDFYPHEMVKVERDRLDKLYKGLKKNE